MLNGQLRRAAWALLGIIVLPWFGGCNLPEPHPEAEMAALAPATGWSGPAVASEVQNNWLLNFNDPELVALVAEAEENNPDLAATAATLAAAVAQSRQANAALFPTLNFGAGVNQTERFELSDGEKLLGVSQSPTQLGVSLDLSWEIDVWGRVRRSALASDLGAGATAADYAAARQSLAGQVAKGWFLAAVAREQLRISEEFVENFDAAYQIAQARFNAGVVSGQDTFTARAQVADARSNAVAALSGLESAVRALEVLLGRYPAEALDPTAELTDGLGPVPAGLPSTMLERRPDLVAADRRVAAAYNLSGSASVARLPTFALSGGFSSTDVNGADLIDPRNMIANLGVNLFRPIFDAGRLQAEFEQAEANQMAAVANYKSVALRAFREVEEALAADQFLFERQALLAESTESYQSAASIAESRYREGETSLTALLDIQRFALQAELELIAVRGQLLTNRIDLHLALGGNFAPGPIDPNPKPPLVPSQEPSPTTEDGIVPHHSTSPRPTTDTDS